VYPLQPVYKGHGCDSTFPQASIDGKGVKADSDDRSLRRPQEEGYCQTAIRYAAILLVVVSGRMEQQTGEPAWDPRYRPLIKRGSK
jgi:hypothetical protein